MKWPDNPSTLLECTDIQVLADHTIGTLCLKTMNEFLKQFEDDAARVVRVAIPTLPLGGLRVHKVAEAMMPRIPGTNRPRPYVLFPELEIGYNPSRRRPPPVVLTHLEPEALVALINQERELTCKMSEEAWRQTSNKTSPEKARTMTRKKRVSAKDDYLIVIDDPYAPEPQKAKRASKNLTLDGGVGIRPLSSSNALTNDPPPEHPLTGGTREKLMEVAKNFGLLAHQVHQVAKAAGNVSQGVKGLSAQLMQQVGRGMTTMPWIGKPDPTFGVAKRKHKSPKELKAAKAAKAARKRNRGR